MNQYRILTPLGVLAVLLVAAAASNTAAATPQTLGCVLTDIEIKSAGARSDSQLGAEKRPLAVIFDDYAKTLTVKQDETEISLQHIAMSQTSMTGAAGTISLGIDRSSWKIVFQTYTQENTRSEFGFCSFSH